MTLAGAVILKVTVILKVAVILAVNAASVPLYALAAPAQETADASKLDAGDRRQIARLQSTIAEQRSRGQFDATIEPAGELFRLCSGKLGESHWMTRDARRQLQSLERLSRLPVEQRSALVAADHRMIEGLGLERQGRAREAEQRYRAALLVRLRLLGESFPDTLISRGRLASSLRGQFRLTEAEKAYRDLLAARRSHLGELHPETASTCADLALTLDYQQRYAESESLHQRCYEINARILEKSHPAVVSSLERLAANLGAQGKLTDEETRRRLALEIVEAVAGEDSLPAGAACLALASCLETQGRHADAQPFFERSYRIHDSKLETGDPTALRTLARRATNLDHLGRHDEASEILEGLLQGLDGSGIESQPLVAAISGWLGVSLERRGRLLAAETRFREEIGILGRLRGNENRQTALAITSLSRNLELQGALDDGSAMAASLLRSMTPVSRLPAHRFAFHSRLAESLRADGDHRGARALYERVLPEYRKVNGDAHSIVRQASLALIDTLHHLGEFEAARDLCQRAHDHARRSFGKESPDTIPVVEALAENASGRGKHAEAAALRERIVELTARRFSSKHARTAARRARLGSTLLDAGDSQRARPTLEAAIELFAELGTTHPAIVKARIDLAHLRLAATDARGAIEHLTKAAAAFDAIRELPWRPTWWLRDVERMSSPRPFLATLLAETGTGAEAWRMLETHFVRGALDIRSRSWLVPRQTVEAAWETRLLDEIGAQRGALRTAETDGEAKSVETLGARVAELEKRHQTLRKAGDRDLAIITNEDPASLDAIGDSLERNEALIAWIDIAPRHGIGTASPRHWVFVLGRAGEPVALRLPNIDTSLSARLRAALRSTVGDETSKTTVESLNELIDRVSGQRLRPLASALQRVDHLIVLPSAGVDGIPVDLLDPRYRVELALSGSMLASTRKSRGTRRARSARARALVIGAPPALDSRDTKPSAEPLDHGALVFVVSQDSNAEQAGVRVGDVIVSYDGRRIGNSDDLSRRIQATSARVGATKDAKVKLRVWRLGKTLDVEVAAGRLGVRTYRESPRSVLRAEREVEELIALGKAAVPASTDGRTAEIDAIRALASKSERIAAVKVLTKGDASEEKIDSLNGLGELHGFRYGHIAAPTSLDDEAPLRSMLTLAPSATGAHARDVLLEERAADGTIRALDILRHWRIDMDVVGFSGCVSSTVSLDGARGLARACFGAGARSIVVNAWPVEDATRRIFWTAFWNRVLVDGSLPSRALDEAKSYMRASGLEDPRHWAGFTLISVGI